MASAMSVTCISSKHSSAVLAAMAAATCGIGSPGMCLARGGDAVVHLGHELVEVSAPLVAEGGGLEEQVHQHGLAAADGTKNVEALGGRLRRARAWQLCRCALRRQCRRLRASSSSLAATAACAGIGLDRARSDQRAILLAESHGRLG